MSERTDKGNAFAEPTVAESGRTDTADAFGTDLPAAGQLQSRLALEDDLRPVRPFVPGRWMALFLALFVPLTAFALWRVFGWRLDQVALGSQWMWGLSAIELAAALALLSRALREAIPARSSSLALLGTFAGGLVVLHVAVILVTFARSPVYPAAGHEWTIGLYCFTFEVALGIPCVLFALWLGSHGLTSRPRRLGILGGVGAGLAADAIWRLVCPYSEPAHAFGSHSTGIAAVVVLGLLLANWWESRWARSR